MHAMRVYLFGNLINLVKTIIYHCQRI